MWSLPPFFLFSCCFRSILVSLHFGSIGIDSPSYSAHWCQYFHHHQCCHCCLLYTLWWPDLCGLHRCISIILHSIWSGMYILSFWLLRISRISFCNSITYLKNVEFTSHCLQRLIIEGAASCGSKKQFLNLHVFRR